MIPGYNDADIAAEVMAAASRPVSSLVDAWVELLAEVGPDCEMDDTWCQVHRTAGSNGRCATGRAIGDMAKALEALGLLTAEGTLS